MNNIELPSSSLSLSSLLSPTTNSTFKNHIIKRRRKMIPLQSMMKLMDGGDSSLISGTTTGGVGVRKSTAGYKSHKEAERRRRQRINAHLSTLRSLLPNKIKTDKASLLAEVVHHVKELRERFADVAMTQDDDDDGCCTTTTTATGSGHSWLLLPSETDEVKLSCCDGDTMTVKATVCCEDRPGLNRDLTVAIRSVRARVVKAEMVTVGGRTKSVVVLQCGGGEEDGIGTLKRALKAVVENRVSSSGLDRVFTEGKSGRFYGSGNTNNRVSCMCPI